MENQRYNNNTFSEIVGLIKSWLPWRSEPTTFSRDFWMPDQSCRVCYECDAQFTIINRRHHCRLCGRVFCGKCTTNTILVSSSDPKTPREDWEKIRVCNYCFKQHQQGDAGNQASNNLELSTSPSGTSLVSSNSGTTANSSSFALGSMPGLIGPYQRVQRGSGIDSHQLSETEEVMPMQCRVGSARSNFLSQDGEDAGRFTSNRADDEFDEYGEYQTDLDSRNSPRLNEYYDPIDYDEMSSIDGSQKLHPDEEQIDRKSLSSSPSHHNGFSSLVFEGTQQVDNKDVDDTGEEYETPSSMYAPVDMAPDSVDFEDYGPLWAPPEPENEEDDREDAFFDYDDNEEDATGEWGSLRPSSSFGSGEGCNGDRTSEEHKKAMKNVVDGHFRALIAQLLQVDNLPVGNEDGSEGWLEIITSLSWDAANLLKPDTSSGGGMDPGGYVKVKCIATGRRSDSMLVKGVVCKKNVAHRRMKSNIEKPRLLILGGALEYQRVSNQLSSFDTLLQQEKDHLKMAVAKIHADRPDILLVEKSVSRFAQEYLLAKDISLVLNIKRSLLERISRCTGAQIIPSVDYLSSQKMGFCDNIRVDRFLEEHGSAGQGEKKLVKTLMYFEGCPKPLGFTVLLMGANGDELKKVKHVVQYGVFAAYHLALETCFLADEGASPADLPLNSPITVALPDKSTTIERSISTVPGFTLSMGEKSLMPQPSNEPQRANSVPTSELSFYTSSVSIQTSETDKKPFLTGGSSLQPLLVTTQFAGSTTLLSSALPNPVMEKESVIFSVESLVADTPAANHGTDGGAIDITGVMPNISQNDPDVVVGNHLIGSELSAIHQDTNENPKELEPIKEEVLPSPSDHQSILVSLSSRCAGKGTVCVRSHLFRIKYYGNFDKPLGRFLRDHLFDQGYRCHSCEMPSEAHVHCYTHRQGSLTISVKKLPDVLLHGEKDGKIWMWHRCLRCPRINGFPPATRRVVMSDAAWGLSFGKFLELSFSNHAAASRVACCGHSLHRDCLRFYGFGNMVACFRYATIDVHSVYLPPSILKFKYENQDWVKREMNEVVERANFLFSDISNAFSKIAEKGVELQQLGRLETVLHKEKAEFEENIQKYEGQPGIDILEIYRLRRQLLFLSYVWDNRLIYAASLEKYHESIDRGRMEEQEKPLVKSITLPVMNASNISIDSLRPEKDLISNPAKELGMHTKQLDSNGDLNNETVDKETDYCDRSVVEQSDHVEVDTDVRRTVSDGEIVMKNLTATLDAAWTGEHRAATEISKGNRNGNLLLDTKMADSSLLSGGLKILEDPLEQQIWSKLERPISPFLPGASSEYAEDSTSWLGMSLSSFYRSINKNLPTNVQKIDKVGEYRPVYVSSFHESECARLLLPVGANDTVIPVYDDEPTSIIAYALGSAEYHWQISGEDFLLSFPSELNLSRSVDESFFEHSRSASVDESFLSMSTSRSSMLLDPLSYTKALHVRVSFGDDGSVGKVRYSVTCYYAKRFEALRDICLPSELDYIRSLSRCKKWGAQGGKSNVFFAKTLDDRFIIKQVTKTELESFIKFAPAYFKYLSESISTKSPTCLAKILGIYQVTTKNLKSGKEIKMDLLVMENILYGRTLKRLYDLKGSSRARYNSDASGNNKVLLDQNLIEAMPTSPIFLGNKAKRLLERAVWNDTAFLALVDVMDYSLLVGVDEEKHELVLGIIDFLRQYTWDKHLETWVKASGILGGPKNEAPTVVSPKQYKKRFRKAMTTYFLMVPDQWSPPNNAPTKSLSDIGEETSQTTTPVNERLASVYSV